VGRDKTLKMFNNSTLTLDDVKNQFIRRTKDTTILDNDVIDAVNDFYSIMKRAERQSKRNRSKLWSAIAVTSSGYDITSLTNIGSDNIKVYEGTSMSDVKPANFIPERNPEDQETGWYVLGDGKMYMTQLESKSVVVIYDKKTPRVTVGSTLASHTLEIDQDLEQTLRRYCNYTFYEGQYQQNLYEENEQKFIEELTRYFSQGTKTRFFNTY